MAEPSWLTGLNALSPDPSPANGPALDALRTAESLSHPVLADDLASQLEAWTNVQFHLPAFPVTSTPANLSGEEYKFDGLDNFYSSIGGQSIDPLLYNSPYGTGYGYTSTSSGFASDGSTLLVHPGEISSATLPADKSLLPAAFHPPAHLDTLIRSTASDSVKEAPVPVPAPAPVVHKGAKRGRKPLLASKADGGDVDGEVTPQLLEEDKRRRNTAASGPLSPFPVFLMFNFVARFRVKKKEREQAMLASAKANEERVKELEEQVKGLKLENTWLRQLVTSKGVRKPSLLG